MNKGDYTIGVNNITGKINKGLNNKYDLMNNIYHEKRHNDNPEKSDRISHVDIVLEQINHASYKKTSNDHKDALSNYILKLLNEELELNPGNKNLVIKKVFEYNNNANVMNAGAQTLEYDKNTNSVGVTLRGIIITPKKKKE